MKTLGEYLQKERLARGKKLEQIAAETRISLNMLRAIEAGDSERLPAPVLVKGFLRAYARQIGLDPEAVILRYQDLTEQEDARLEALEKFHRRFHPRRSRKKEVISLLALGLVAIAVASWLWVRHGSQTSRLAAGPKVPALIEAPRQLPGHSATATKSPSQSETGGEQSASAPARRTAASAGQSANLGTGLALSSHVSGSVQARGETFSLASKETLPPGPVYLLRAETVEPTWLHITIDGTREHEYLLRPGDRLKWKGHSGFELDVGNAGGLELYLNNKPLKPLGQTGQVVHLKLPDPSLLMTPESVSSEQPKRP